MLDCLVFCCLSSHPTVGALKVLLAVVCPLLTHMQIKQMIDMLSSCYKRIVVSPSHWKSNVWKCFGFCATESKVTVKEKAVSVQNTVN